MIPIFDYQRQNSFIDALIVCGLCPPEERYVNQKILKGIQISEAWKKSVEKYRQNLKMSDDKVIRQLKLHAKEIKQEGSKGALSQLHLISLKLDELSNHIKSPSNLLSNFVQRLKNLVLVHQFSTTKDLGKDLSVELAGSYMDAIVSALNQTDKKELISQLAKLTPDEIKRVLKNDRFFNLSALTSPNASTNFYIAFFNHLSPESKQAFFEVISCRRDALKILSRIFRAKDQESKKIYLKILDSLSIASKVNFAKAVAHLYAYRIDNVETAIDQDEDLFKEEYPLQSEFKQFLANCLQAGGKEINLQQIIENEKRIRENFGLSNYLKT